MIVRPRPDSEDPERVEVEFRKDPTLSFLVALMDSTPGAALSITLLLPSGTVTGRLVSRIDYYRVFADQLRDAVGGEGKPGAEALKGLF
jgi:hypothetical protein